MFSVVSVHQPVNLPTGSRVLGGGGLLQTWVVANPPRQTCSNLFNLDLTVQPPPPPPAPAPYPQTCSNLFIMKRLRLTSGRFASYWNVFLFQNFTLCINCVTGLGPGI